MKTRVLPETQHSMRLMKRLVSMVVVAACTTQAANAAVALDRTRVIFDGSQNSMSLNIRNDNTKMPFLAQAWVENKDGQKIKSPLLALPPLQRLEPGAKSLVKIQLAPGALATLPKDRESLFYFNLREIPPKSTKANVLQIALQTRVKMFYRPEALVQSQAGNTTPWQEKLTLTREGDRYKVNNPTPYYVTLVGEGKTDMKPVMVAPKSTADLGVRAATLGSQPRIAYINDWGGRPVLTFSCAGATCKVSSNKAG